MFNDVQDETENFRTTLYRTPQGKILSVMGNLCKILSLDSHWGARLSMNEMSGKIMYDGVEKDEHFVNEVRAWVKDNYHLNFSIRDVRTALEMQSTKSVIHPVREWLKTLKWDGVPRIHRISKEVLHSTSSLAPIYIRRTLIGAVRRCFEPGTKMETIPVLIDKEGSFKFAFWKTLVGEDLFGSCVIGKYGRDVLTGIHQKFCVEFYAVEGTTNMSAVERLRGVITSSVDFFRAHYKVMISRRPRSCFLVCNVNHEELLATSAGAWRFWLIKCEGAPGLGFLKANREQIWAEAVHLCNAGENHWLDEEQDAAREEEAYKILKEKK